MNGEGREKGDEKEGRREVSTVSCSVKKSKPLFTREIAFIFPYILSRSDGKSRYSTDCPPLFQNPITAFAIFPNFAIKCRNNGTVNCFLTSPFDRYQCTCSEPSLKISSLHLILSYRAGTILEVVCKEAADWPQLTVTTHQDWLL